MKCTSFAVLAVAVLTACDLPTDGRTGSLKDIPLTATTPGSGPNSGLLAGARLYVQPESRPSLQAAQWRTSRPADAAAMDRLAAQPAVIWFGDWSVNVERDVAQLTADIVRAGALPVYVVYNIPVRDCNLFSAGGASNGTVYRTWIRSFAAGLGNARAAVILEPDAVAGIDCLTSTQQAERYALLRDAVEVLSAQGSAVYIDAGNPVWLSPAEIAARLGKAGIANAAGFALNVSNFVTTADNAVYGSAVSALVGGKHFVIDTSRNGRGPEANHEWCNPAGRGLGEKPTTLSTHALIDALLWIKTPGESDGECNGGPRAGDWHPTYALGLIQRALDL